MAASPARGVLEGSPTIGRVELDGATVDDLFTSAQSMDGARAVVTALETAPDASQTIEQMVRAPKLGLVSAHPHGSKVVRAIGRLASKQQVARMLVTLSADLMQAADSASGSVVLCDLIGKCDDEAAVTAVARALVHSSLSICCSVNGRKVILAAIANFSTDVMEGVYAALGRELPSICTDQIGYITVQRVLDLTADRSQRTRLLTQIEESTDFLIDDQYGNYVVQRVVGEGHRWSREVGRRIAGHLVDTACNKFAFNVVERCLDVGPDATQEILIKELLEPAKLQCLINDSYGHFVVESSVKNAPAHLLDQLCRSILPLTSESPFGSRIESKLKGRVGGGSLPWATSPPPMAGGLPRRGVCADSMPRAADLAQAGGRRGDPDSDGGLPKPKSPTGAPLLTDYSILNEAAAAAPYECSSWAAATSGWHRGREGFVDSQGQPLSLEAAMMLHQPVSGGDGARRVAHGLVAQLLAGDGDEEVRAGGDAVRKKDAEDGGRGLVDFKQPVFDCAFDQDLVVIEVIRRGGSHGAITATYRTRAVSAIDGQSFLAASGDVCWADGETGGKNFEVRVLHRQQCPQCCFIVELDVFPKGATGKDGRRATVVVTNVAPDCPAAGVDVLKGGAEERNPAGPSAPQDGRDRGGAGC
eukprot:TRINITY_DN23753_c0_g1_i1.p1 TRINITY_DN23753_c0_g1~~TRINITY_DN23753_c0_g1_i1.p1  ORF type:complete len:679 (+),score=189.52 TRINITY_DN23753_c0_g1_i1:103-2037(+)